MLPALLANPLVDSAEDDRDDSHCKHASEERDPSTIHKGGI